MIDPINHRKPIQLNDLPRQEEITLLNHGDDCTIKIELARYGKFWAAAYSIAIYKGKGGIYRHYSPKTASEEHHDRAIGEAIGRIISAVAAIRSSLPNIPVDWQYILKTLRDKAKEYEDPQQTELFK
jgi:hypothetical protein